MKSNLPFPRGETASSYGIAGVTLSDTWCSILEGQEFEVTDTVHGTGTKVTLRVVKNDKGSDIDMSTAATDLNNLYRFSANAKDFGRRIAGETSTAGEICVPIDDAYGATDIPQYDLFYVVVKGFCNCMSEGSSVSMSAHDAVSCDNAGRMDGATSTEAQFIFGTLDEAATTANTAYRVWVDINLRPSPPAAGS